MSNDRYQERLQSQVDAAIRCFQETSSESHRGLQGEMREIAVQHLFRPLLTGHLDIGTGKIIDSHGGESKQIDIILFNRSVIPAVMFSEQLGLYPVESVCYAIEVKSTSTAAEISRTVESSKSISRLRPLNGSAYPNYAYFAFSTDLVAESSEDELTRFQRSELDGDSLLKAICVVGRGYWCVDPGTGRWLPHGFRCRHAEVLGFLAGILNTIPYIMMTHQMTGFRVGHYFLS